MSMNWLAKLFAARDRRRARRHFSLPLIAFYWDGALSTPHAVPDISHRGLFVRTQDRWLPRTLVRVTLRKSSERPDKSEETLTVQCRVVRAGEDGVGMAIMLAEEEKSDFPATLESLATRKQLNEFFERLLADPKETPLPEPPYLPFPELAPITVQASTDD